MKNLLLSLLLALPACSWATTYYFAACGAGAVAGCVAGNDANDGLTTATPKLTIAAAWALWNALPAGSSILWARGSDQTSAAAAFLDNRNCLSTNRCTLGAYAPSWLSGTDSGTTSAVASGTVTDASKAWTVNGWVGYSVRMRTAFGSMIELPITSNTATVLTLGRNFPELPASAVAYTIQGQKPILRSNTSYIIALFDSGSMDHNEGVTISNLRFISTTVASASILVGNDQDYTILDSIEVQNSTTIGVQFDGGGSNNLNVGSDGVSDHFVLRDSFIHDNKTIGALLGGNYVLVEGNTFQYNGVTGLDHQIYLDDGTARTGLAALSALKNVVRHNTLVDAHYGGPGSCAGVAIVVHGRKDGLTIEHNLLKETTPPASNQCIGISVDAGYSGPQYGSEGFSDVQIRGNHVIQYSMGIGLDLCHACVIENNYVYSGFSTGVFGINMRDKNFTPMTGSSSSTIDAKGFAGDDSANPNYQPDNIRIRNNTVYLTAPNGSSWGIALNGNIADDLTGGDYELVSNLIYLGPTATTSTGCFDTRNIVVGSFTAMDYNLCFSSSASTPKWDLARSNLAANQAVGFDTHSLTSDPAITVPTSANGYSLAIPTGSPAKNAGHPTRSSGLAYGNIVRGVTPDIGAYEFGASGTVPYPSVWGSAQ